METGGYYGTISYAAAYFMIQTGKRIVPVEVKAETNLQAQSLKAYHKKFEPEQAVRISMADYKEEEWLVNLPLYAVQGL